MGAKQAEIFPPVERNRLTQARVLAASVVGTSVLYFAAQDGRVAWIATPLIVIGGFAMLLIAWRSWKFGIQAVMVIVIFEGAVRKWFLPSASDLVYFYKDFVMLAALLGYWSQRRKTPLVIKADVQLVLVAALAFVAYALACISNPRLPNFIVGVLGFKAYCLYIPLAFMVPRLFPNKEKLIGFLKWYVMLIIPVVILSVVQFRNADQASSLNKYAWNQDQVESGEAGAGIASFEDSRGNTYVRVTGTFSYLSGLAIYLPVAFVMLLSVLSASKLETSSGTRVLLYLALAAVVATAFMTGSRSSVIDLLVITLIFLALTSLKSLKDRILQVSVGGALIYFALTAFFPQALDAMKTRAFGSEGQVEEGQARLENIFRLPLDAAKVSGVFGYGTGSTQNSVPSVMTKLNLQFTGEVIPIEYEEESSRVMLDLGIAGYLLYGLLRITLLATLWRSVIGLSDRTSRAIGAASLAILTIYLFVGGAVVNHTQNVYQWFLVGICFALANSERLRESTAILDRTIEISRVAWSPNSLAI
jgi:O-antigen ligase/polysaccharide polymerase Wzy-like membrane protein